MLPVSENDIRASFVNATRKELSELSIPAVADFDRLDYLGWRDPRYAKRAWLVAPTANGLVGVVLRQADVDPRRRAQCSWCQDVTLPNDVVLYSARRAGNAGRKGDSLGTLVCMNFQCSANVRKRPPVAYLGFDVEAARLERIEVLQTRAAAFATAVASVA